MPRESLDRELQQLEDGLLLLGSMVERAIVESVDVLRHRDHEGARKLMAGDRLLNQRRFALEDDCLALIARRQPMASDLRTVAAVLAIAGELERIGDYAKGIAKIELLMGPEPFIKPLIDIPLMAQKGRDMLHRALDSFVRRDAEQARAIPQEDDEMDDLYNQVYRELLALILGNPTNINQATHLLWVAHNLERTADRVTNICERVVFTVTGELLELDVQPDELLDRARA